MKASTAYFLITLLGATQASAECVEGTRQEISSGFTVQHKCGFFRQGGTAIKNINSEAECAALARDTGVNAATYYAPRKQCIVAKEGGKDLPYPGAVLLEKVEEDPFPVEPEEEDPFAETCEERAEACGKREQTLQANLDKCNADLKKASRPATCGIAKWGQGYYSRQDGVNIAQCKAKCNDDPRCLSYSANKNYSGQNVNCYLYDKETADAPHGTWPDFVQYDKRCG